LKKPRGALGNVISTLRTQAEMSQEELAERAGIHRTYVSQLERGLKTPTVTMLARLAKALNTTASRIMKIVEET
jgi:transcriptional regulator with XRE-family HTH domain